MKAVIVLLNKTIRARLKTTQLRRTEDVDVNRIFIRHKRSISGRGRNSTRQPGFGRELPVYANLLLS